MPKTRYAKSSGVNVAYQVVGEGRLDLVYVPGWLSNVEMMWENPMLARFLHRLASFSRLIVFDKRGTGLSDRVAELPTLEQRMDDVRAVLDAIGSARAALFGHSEGGCMCIMFAPTTTLGRRRERSGFAARRNSNGTGVARRSLTSPTMRRVSQTMSVFRNGWIPTSAAAHRRRQRRTC